MTEGAEREELTLQGAAGQSIAARRYGPASGPAVILAHGILCHQDLPELVALAAGLTPRYTVYTLDFRGHGRSGGTFSMGREEYRDLAIVVGHVRASHPRVAAIGFSFGGFHSVLAATVVPVDVLCLVSAPAHLRLADHFFFGRAYFRTFRRIVKRRRKRVRVNLLSYPRLVPRDVIGTIVAPVLIVHGTDDWIVSERHARLLHERAAGPKRLDVVPGGLHAEYLLEQDLPGMTARLGGWLDRYL